MSENDKGRVIRNEILAGVMFGTAAGITIAIAAFLSLNVWFLLFLPVDSSLAILIIAVVWITFVMSSTLYYKPFRWAIYRNLAFLVGLFISISLMNYIYIVLSYNIDVLYSSPGFIQIPALVIIGSCLGFGIIISLKKEETKEIAQ